MKMKKLIYMVSVFSLLAGIAVFGGQTSIVKAAGVEITEQNFGNDQSLLSAIKFKDTNLDGILSDEEAAPVTSLYFSSATNDISNVVKYFPNLSYVSVNTGDYDSLTINHNPIKSISITAHKVVSLKGNHSITKVFYDLYEMKGKADFSKTKGYEKVKEFLIYCSGATSVVAPNQNKLTNLSIRGTKMSKIDMSKYKKLTTLNLSGNQLKSINVKKNSSLVSLACYNNKLTSLNISSNKKLKDIGVGDNKLTKIDTTKNSKLLRVVAYNNKIKSYSPVSNKKLTEINMTYNKLTKLDVTKNKDLRVLCISGNKIKQITLSKNKKLEIFNAGNTSLKKLSLAKSAKLSNISVGSNYKLLKNIKFKSNSSLGIAMKLSGAKEYRLTEILPALKGYTFSSSNEKITIDEAGKLTMPSLAKKEYASVMATNGNQTAYISLNSVY